MGPWWQPGLTLLGVIGPALQLNVAHRLPLWNVNDLLTPYLLTAMLQSSPEVFFSQGHETYLMDIDDSDNHGSGGRCHVLALGVEEN